MRGRWIALTHCGSTYDDMDCLLLTRRSTADATLATLRYAHVWGSDEGRSLALDDLLR